VSIFINKDTKLVVQGITGRDGSFHTKQMMEFGTQVVAGVTPGKGGQKFEDKVPIFNTVADAVNATGANTSVIYVPPMFAADAIMEAADAGISLIIAITEGVPVLDMTRVWPFVKEHGARLIGPNCPGLISSGQSKVGITSPVVTPGPVASRSGTLTTNSTAHARGLGQTTCVGIGATRSTARTHRLPRGLGRPNQGRLHAGRDWRHRRAGRRALREGEDEEASRRLHRRPDGASGTTDGPCWRDHQRLVRHGD
jgi:succinyl-CoA synthetase alpha subunit